MPLPKGILVILMFACIAGCTGDALITSGDFSTSDEGFSKKSSMESSAAVSDVTQADLLTDASATMSDAAAKKGAVVEKEVLLEEVEGFTDGPLFIPCLNGGEGEDVDFTGSYRFVANVVTTPSGNQHISGWLDEWEMEFTGRTTSDHWIGSGIAHVAMNVKADGSVRAMEPLHETYVKDGTGERLNMLWHFKVTPEVPYSFENISCTILGSN